VDIYRCILPDLCLRNIINLTATSKYLRDVLLLPEFWYVITDTKKVLYNFIRWIFRSGQSSYPLNKIQRMQYGDDDGFHLLPITPNNSDDMNEFYDHFTGYRYLYANTSCKYFSREIEILNGIHITSSSYIFSYDIFLNQRITEIIAPNMEFDCASIVKYCPLIEKLVVNTMQYFAPLKQTQLKYLRIENVNTDIIQNLPDTIEFLTIGHMKPLLSFDELNKFPHLKYLKIHLPSVDFSTSLSINTIHFVVECHPRAIVKINVPNAKNIVISQREVKYQTNPIHWTVRRRGGETVESAADELKGQLLRLNLSSLEAVTCDIINIDIVYPKFFLPKCSGVIFRDTRSALPLPIQDYPGICQYYQTVINYDSDVFSPKLPVCNPKLSVVSTLWNNVRSYITRIIS
jgi:hypothetical protein